MLFCIHLKVGSKYILAFGEKSMIFPPFIMYYYNRKFHVWSSIPLSCIIIRKGLLWSIICSSCILVYGNGSYDQVFLDHVFLYKEMTLRIESLWMMDYDWVFIYHVLLYPESTLMIEFFLIMYYCKGNMSMSSLSMWSFSCMLMSI